MDATHTLTIGNNANTWPAKFIGSIDEVAILNTALTQTQIQHLYQRQSATYSGTFESRIYDPVNNTLTKMAFSTQLPFYKELAPNGSSESTANYSSLTNSTLMSGNVGL